jgi:hypothetical protein
MYKRYSAALIICFSMFLSAAVVYSQTTIEASFDALHFYSADPVESFLPENFVSEDYLFDPLYQTYLPGKMTSHYLLTGKAQASFTFGGNYITESFRFYLILSPSRSAQPGQSGNPNVISFAGVDNPLIFRLLESKGFKVEQIVLEASENLLADSAIDRQTSIKTESINWKLQNRSTDIRQFDFPFKSSLVFINPENNFRISVTDGHYYRSVYRDENLREFLNALGFEEIRWPGSRAFQIQLTITVNQDIT